MAAVAAVGAATGRLRLESRARDGGVYSSSTGRWAGVFTCSGQYVIFLVLRYVVGLAS